jgi:DNA-binding CsgD family transcriptional regulator
MVLASTRAVAEAEDRHSVIDNAELLAEIAVAHGSHRAAAEMTGAAAAQREALSSAPNPVAAERLARIDAELARVLDAGTLAAARAEGAKLTDESLPRRVGAIAREIVGPRRPLAGTTPVVPPSTAGVEIPKLTNREFDVLRLLAQGKSTAEVSETLYISQRTTSTHITNILGKLDVDSRTAAVALAMRLGLV